ncbi:MAG: c-type cytochrome [Nitrospira sp.]|nr:MAG: c-type cytochrome [Nitrospira sp.]
MRSIRRGMTGSGLRMVILGGAVGFLSVAVGVTGCALFQSEQVKKGKHLYEHYCMHCHGEHGRQNEGYNWAQMPDPRPKDLSNKGEMSTFKDEEIFNTISRDMKDTTPNVGDKIGDDEFAVPTMPTFKYTLSEDEIWAIVGYVRTLHGTKLAFNVEDRKKELDDKLKEVQGVFDQAKQALAAADKTAEDEADKAGKDVDDNATAKERDAMDKATKELEIAQAAATNFIKRPEFAPIPRPDLAMSADEAAKQAERGKQLFSNKYGCNACHRVGEAGGMVGPPLDRAGFRLNGTWVFRWVKYPQAMKSETRMPNLGLSDADAKAVTMYLTTLKAPPPEKPLGTVQKASAE